MFVETADNKFTAHFSCKTEKTRYGFRHLCKLNYFDFHDVNDDTKDGSVCDKSCYYNRTWERYEYQTVMRKTVLKAIDKRMQMVRNDILKEFHVSTLNNRGRLFYERCAEDRTIKNLREIYNKL